MKKCLFRLIGAGVLFLVPFNTACYEFDPDGPIGTDRHHIINGTPVANPQDTGHVQVRPGTPAFSTGQGSGTLLDNSTVLGSAHTLDQSNCPAQNNPTGNTLFDCFFRPSSHIVLLGNDNANQLRTPDRISVHPRYLPVPDGFDTGVDVTVLRIDQSFTVQGSTSSWSQFISFFPPPVVNSIATVFGYGRGTLQGGTGILRTAVHLVSSIAPDGSTFTMSQNAGVIPYKGDSGGPVYGQGEFDIAGVMRNVDPGLPPTTVTAVAADAFRTWANLVSQSLLDFNLDVDFDGVPDAVFLARNQPSWFGPAWAIQVLGSTFCTGVCTFPIFPDDGAPVSSLAFAGGDFNGDGFGDVVGQIDNAPFYFHSDPLDLGSFTDPGFAFLSLAYEKFIVGDFNQDGISDIEAHDSNGVVVVYFGSADGLQPGLDVGGFPAFSAEDGKLATVSGKGNATVNFPSVRFYVNLEAGRTNFDVHMFDGDQGGADDVAGGVTCYSLHADGNYDGFSDGLIASRSSDDFTDHAWGNVYSGATHASAQAPTGDFYYFLQVDLVEGSCAAPQESNLAAINSFLVRGTGDVWLEDNRLSLMGWDTIGDTAPGSLGAFVARDNLYDGNFALCTDVGAATTSVTFRDADADDLDDASDPAALYGPEDVPSTGVAVGASADIRYSIYDANETIVLDAQNVSGNNDVTGALQDVEERTVPTNGVSGTWCWEWNGVLAGNNVHIWVPLSNVASPGWPLRLAAESLRPLHWSTARTRDVWEARQDAIAALLPIRLGAGNEGIVVSDVPSALALLAEREPSVGGAGSKVALCHGAPGKRQTLVVGASALDTHLAHGDSVGPTQALAELAAELLTTKLNIAGAAAGENLAATRIYGTGVKVSDAVAEADSLVSELDTVCTAEAAAMLADIERVTRLLRAANRAEVTNVFPQVSPQAKAASQRQEWQPGRPGSAL